MKIECTNELSRLPIPLTIADLRRLLPVYWDEMLPAMQVFERRVYLTKGNHEECPFNKNGICDLTGQRPETCIK